MVVPARKKYVSPPTNQLDKAINDYYQNLTNLESGALSHIRTAYSQSLAAVDREINKVLKKIDSLPSTPENEAQIKGLMANKNRLVDLGNQITEVMNDFGDHTATAVEKVKTGATKAGQESFRATMEASGIDPVVFGGFNILPSPALNELQSRLSDGSPVSSLADSFGPEAGLHMRKSLVEGIALGLNPRQVAANFRQIAGITRARAETIARTEMLQSFRESNRQSMVANKDVVKAWQWYSSLDRRTCPACWAMHGSVHELKEKMATHPNCRCTMLPVTKTFKELGLNVNDAQLDYRLTTSGNTLFQGISQEDQIAVLGPAAFNAYNSGAITSLSSFVAKTDSPIWGKGMHAKSLSEILGKEQAKQYYRGTFKGAAPVNPNSFLNPIVIPLDTGVPHKLTIFDTDPDWVKATKEKINAGINTPKEAQAVGKIIRKQIESEADPVLVAKSKQEVADLKKHGNVVEKALIKNQNADIVDNVEAKRLSKELQDTAAKLNQANLKYREATGFNRLNVIKKLREVDKDYGTGNFANTVWSKTAKHDKNIESMIRHVADRFPKSWVDAMSKYEIATEQTTRGFFRRATPFNRIFTIGADRFGHIEQTTIHELTHFAEYVNKHISKLVNQFFDDRTSGELVVKLSDAIPLAGYGPEEITKIDRFVSPYMGKIYPGELGDAKEVATMGLQQLLSDDLEFGLAEDPTYIDFLLGLLFGNTENQEEIVAEVAHEELIKKLKVFIP